MKNKISKIIEKLIKESSEDRLEKLKRLKDQEKMLFGDDSDSIDQEEDLDVDLEDGFANIEDIELSDIDLDDIDLDEIDLDDLDLDDIDLDEIDSELFDYNKEDLRAKKTKDINVDDSKYKEFLYKNFPVEEIKKKRAELKFFLIHLEPRLEKLKDIKSNLEKLDNSEEKQRKIKEVDLQIKKVAKIVSKIKYDLAIVSQNIEQDLSAIYDDLDNEPMDLRYSGSKGSKFQSTLRQISLLEPAVDNILQNKSEDYIRKFWYLYYIRHYLNVFKQVVESQNPNNPPRLIPPSGEEQPVLKSKYYSYIDMLIASDGQNPAIEKLRSLLNDASYGVTYTSLGEDIFMPNLDSISISSDKNLSRSLDKYNKKIKSVPALKWAEKSIESIVNSYKLKSMDFDDDVSDQLKNITTDGDDSIVRKALSEEEFNRWDKETSNIINLHNLQLNKEYQEELENIKSLSQGEDALYGGTASPEEQLAEDAPTTIKELGEKYLAVKNNFEIALKTLDKNPESENRFLAVANRPENFTQNVFVTVIRKAKLQIESIKQLSESLVSYTEDEVEDIFFKDDRAKRKYDAEKSRRDIERKNALAQSQLAVYGDNITDEELGQVGSSFVEKVEKSIKAIIALYKRTTDRKTDGTKDKLFTILNSLLNSQSSPLNTSLNSFSYNFLDDDILKIYNEKTRISKSYDKIKKDFGNVVSAGVEIEEVKNLQAQIENLDRPIKLKELYAYYPDIETQSGIRQHLLKNIELDKWSRSNIKEVAKIYFKAIQVYISFIENSVKLDDNDSVETLSILKNLKEQDLQDYFSDVANKERFKEIITSDESEGDYAYSVPRKVRVLLNELILSDDSTIRKFVTMNLNEYYVANVYNRMFYHAYYSLAQYFQNNFPQTQIGKDLNGPSEVDGWSRSSSSKPLGANLLLTLSNLASNRTGLKIDSFDLFPSKSHTVFDDSQKSKLAKELSGKKIDALIDMQKDPGVASALRSIKSNANKIADDLAKDLNNPSGTVGKVRERHLKMPSGESDNFFSTLGEDSNIVIDKIKALDLDPEVKEQLDDMEFDFDQFLEEYKKESKKGLEFALDTKEYIEDEIEFVEDEKERDLWNRCLDYLTQVLDIISNNSVSKNLNSKMQNNILKSFVLNSVTRLKKGELTKEEFGENENLYRYYRIINGTLSPEDFDSVSDYDSFQKEISEFSSSEIYKLNSKMKKSLTKYVKNLTKNLEKIASLEE